VFFEFRDERVVHNVDIDIRCADDVYTSIAVGTEQYPWLFSCISLHTGQFVGIGTSSALSWISAAVAIAAV